MVSGNIFGKFLQATGVPSIRRKSNIYGGEDDAAFRKMTADGTEAISKSAGGQKYYEGEEIPP